MVITKQYLNEHLTKHGAITKAQLNALGYAWPPISGWRKRVIGQELSPKNKMLFEAGKTVYAKSTERKHKKAKRKGPHTVESYRAIRREQILQELLKDPALAEQVLEDYANTQLDDVLLAV